MAVRMLQPKILQITLDGVLLFWIQGEKPESLSHDPVAEGLYSILPAIERDSLWRVLLGIALIYLTIALIRSISQVISSALAASATEKAIKKFRDSLFGHLQRLPIAFHKDNRSGEMVQRCTGDVDTVRRFLLNQVVEMIRLVAIFIAAFVMMAIVNLTYALIAIALVPFIGITAYLFFKRESKVWEEHEDEADKLTTMVSENLNGIRVVKAFANEDFEKRKFDSQNRVKQKVGLKHVALHATFWPLSDLLVHIQITLSIFVGGWMTLNNVITVGEYSSFFTYGIMVTWPMRQLGRVVSQMGMASVAMERLTKIIDANEEEYDGLKIADEDFTGHIVFENVNFSYVEGEVILKNVSFEILPNEKVALIGPTGSGKSTIVDLLLRLREPDSGTIYLDGIALNKLSKAFLRKKIGIVLQKSTLFSTSVRNNMAYADPSLDMEIVLDAARVSSIDEISHIFSDGYDTLVGEKGVTLSGGQKQRVSLARTVLEFPSIMVLDDSTSAVDTETEFKIQDALEKGLDGKTAVFISQRITSLQLATKIIVLDDGEIVDIGSPAELISKPGFYREMVEIQLALEKDIINEIKAQSE